MTRFAFGATAAIMTSMALIVGLGSANSGRTAVIGGLLIIAIADNLSDSLSIHVYQESENLEQRTAFRVTLTNFLTRLVIALTFVALVVALPTPWVVAVAVGAGLVLLSLLTVLLARARRASVSKEIIKHLAVAAAVIAASKLIGVWIVAHVR